MADYIIMARDTEDRTGAEWIAQLGALNLWGVSNLMRDGKTVSVGDRAVFYWTNRKLFVGSCIIERPPTRMNGSPPTPLLAASSHELHLSNFQLWERPLPSRLVHQKGVGVKWSPGSILRLAPGQYETIVALSREVHVDPPAVPDREKVDSQSEHVEIQASIAALGAGFGYQVWVPRNDLTRVLACKSDLRGAILDSLPPASLDAKYTAEIDCIWFLDNQVMGAFEVEATTSIYSGLLRMADLVAVYPNISFDLYIVAPADRLDKFVTQVRRPVFAKMKPSLATKCGFLSFAKAKELLDLQQKAKGHLQASIVASDAHWEN